MQKCSNCGHQNRPGIVFCENCGASLIGKVPLDTKSLEDQSDAELAQIGVDASVLTDVKVQGSTIFTENDTLRLGIEGSPDPIVLKPKSETIFGRRDPATGAMPDIDLTPYAGYRMGVSRRHAAIRIGSESNLDLWDLGSSNGTFLNGQRLSAHRPYRLHDGDEVRLGQMVIHIFFQSGGAAALSKGAAPIASAAEIKAGTAGTTAPFQPEEAKIAGAEVSAEPAAADKKPAELPASSAAPAQPATEAATSPEAAPEAAPATKPEATPEAGPKPDAAPADQPETVEPPSVPGAMQTLTGTENLPLADPPATKPVEDKGKEKRD